MKRYDGTCAWWGRQVGRRIVSLGVPYVLWCVAGGVYVRAICPEVQGDLLQDLGVTCFFPTYANLWYVKCLLLAGFFFPVILFLTKLFRVPYLNWFCGILLVTLAFLPMPGKRSLLTTVVYFSLGIGLGQNSEKCVSLWYRHRTAFICAGALCVCVVGTLRTLGIRLADDHFWVLVQQPCSLAFLWGMFEILFEHFRVVRQFVLSSVSQSISGLSFFIYCFHYILQIPILRYGWSSSISGVLFCWFAMTSVSVLVAWILNKRARLLYALLSGGR